MADETIENTQTESNATVVTDVDGVTTVDVFSDPVAADNAIVTPPEPQPTAAAAPVDESQYLLPDKPADLTQDEWFNMLAANHKFLHESLSAVAPIEGVSGSMQDIRGYQISFRADATEEQRSAAYATLLTLPAKLKRLRAREAAMAQVDAWFNEQIAFGFRVPNGLQLGLKTEDITLLTGNFILSQQAAAMGLPLPPIVDMNGLAYSFANIEELTQIMLAYGQHRGNLTMFYASQKAEVEAQFAEPVISISPTHAEPVTPPVTLVEPASGVSEPPPVE